MCWWFCFFLLFFLDSADGVKFGFAIHNWTWSVDAGIPVTRPDFAYLAPGFEFGFYSEMPLLMNQTMLTSSLLLNASMGPYNFNFYVDQGYVLDNRPAIVAKPLDVPLFYFDLIDGTNGLTYVIPMRLGFCPPYDLRTTFSFGRYKDIWYDPSLEILFNPPSPTSPSASPSKIEAAKKQWVVAVAVSIPLLAVIIITVLLLAHFVPAVRHFFRPFSKRPPADRNARSDPTTTRSTSNGDRWTRANKPTDL